MLKPYTKGKALLPMLPVQYRLPEKGKPLPDRVVYIPHEGLVAHIPTDPDLPHVVTAAGKPPYSLKRGKLPNGLSPRADCMARLIARGVSAADAFRSAYGQADQDAVKVTRRAGKVVSRETFREIVAGYRQEWEGEGQQQAHSMRDFVLSRLTLEAQTAKQDAARIQALKLLGQSEAMWTTVQRTEKSIDPKDLQALKVQLEQRLRAAMDRLTHGRIDAPSLGIGTEDGPEPDRTTPVEPLNAHGTPQEPAILTRGLDHREMVAGDFCLEGPDQFSVWGPRQMTEGDL